VVNVKEEDLLKKASDEELFRQEKIHIDGIENARDDEMFHNEVLDGIHKEMKKRGLESEYY